MVVGSRPAPDGGRWVEISPHRLPGWLDGFYARHDGATEQTLTLTGASNGDTATLHPPPGLTAITGIDALLCALPHPPRIGLLLARKGAVAVGIADGTSITASKVERFHIHGRTAAGGWSQQRYAHRRDNQAQAAADKAADLAARILLPHSPQTQPDAETAIQALVCGGDRPMLDTILRDRRLEPLVALRHPHLLEVAEPRLEVLREAAAAARRVRIYLKP